MAKKYIVREGFIVALALINQANGQGYERVHVGGEEVVLEDDQAEAHAHKIEFASEKDRAAALASEKAAAIEKRAAAGNPADLVAQLAAALQLAIAGGVQAAAPASST